MKGKIRKIISLALMAVMLFGCFGITGCQDNTVQLQAQIDALQAELEQQAGKMQTLESEKEELNETITQLETENKSLMDRVEKLEWNDQIQKGAFYSLQEAYEKDPTPEDSAVFTSVVDSGGVSGSLEYFSRIFCRPPGRNVWP